jgi:hypothetical protein
MQYLKGIEVVFVIENQNRKKIVYGFKLNNLNTEKTTKWQHGV